MLMNILAGLKPPRQEVIFEKELVNEAAEACPALAALTAFAPSDKTPFTNSIVMTLVTAYQAFEQTGHAHVLAGLTADTLEAAEENLKAGRIDEHLLELPQLKILMREKNSWAAGAAIALTSLHYVLTASGALTSDTPSDPLRASIIDEVPDEPMPTTTKPTRPAPPSRGLGDLLSFFASLEAIGVPMSVISLHPVVQDHRGTLEVRGVLEAPVPFNLLAKINSTVKKAWPTAPDMEFSGGADGSVGFKYVIEQ